MSECMYQQNTSPKGCYYENKDHSVIFIECDTADCYYKQLKRLKLENEKLREEIYATRNNRLKMYESFETECNKYKQALEEIREICKKETSHYDRLIEIVTKVGEVLK